MKKYLFLLLFVLFFSGLGLAACVVRSGNCIGGETCLFSMYNVSDSHAGLCGYYSYSVCCDEIQSAFLRNSCSAGEWGILSFYQQNNTHVETFSYSYANHLCVSPVRACTLRSSCLSGETGVVSMYNTTNSHVANLSYYSNQLCCAADTTAPQISGEAVNVTKIKTGEPVRLTANVTDNIQVSTVIVTVQYPSGTKSNFTMALLSGSTYFYDFTDTFQTGMYTWANAYANDTSNNFASSTPNKQFGIYGNIYSIAGQALYSGTGLPMANANVTAIIQETAFNGTAITNSVGNWNVIIYATLQANKEYNLVIKVFDSQGRESYLIEKFRE